MTEDAIEQAPAEYVIEPARVEDAEAILAIRRAAWLESYPNEPLGITVEGLALHLDGANGASSERRLQNWRRYIETADEHNAVFVARSHDGVVGFVRPRDNTGEHRIGYLFVDPNHQGEGVGSALIEQAIDFLGRDEPIAVSVVSYNERAIAFYQKHGFKMVAGTEKPTTFSEDAGISPSKITMVRPGDAN